MNEQYPTLHFFRRTPERLLAQPPLASSLQSLESCFLLLALERFPQAHIACASAIESALKAGLVKGPEDKTGLNNLFAEAKKRYPKLDTFSEVELKEFRTLRNRLIHYGFGPEDDGPAAASLVAIGFRFLAECYLEFFSFSMMDGLLQEYAIHLQAAQDAYSKAIKSPRAEQWLCLASFAHLVRWSIRESHLPYWELAFLEVADTEGNAYEYQSRRKETIERRLDPSWHFTCPVCGSPDSFICGLDDNLLDAGKVQVKQGICVNCDFKAAQTYPSLIHALCHKEVERQSEEVLRDYGILNNP